MGGVGREKGDDIFFGELGIVLTMSLNHRGRKL